MPRNHGTDKTRRPYRCLSNTASLRRVLYYSGAVSKDPSVHSQKEEAEKNGGAIGRHALVALLLALEVCTCDNLYATKLAASFPSYLQANYFVLTTGSNWSRLIDELRRTIIDV